MVLVFKRFCIREIWFSAFNNAPEDALVFIVRVQVEMILAREKRRVALVGSCIGLINKDKIKIPIKIRNGHIAGIQNSGKKKVGVG